jgi:hypothetical protein
MIGVGVAAVIARPPGPARALAVALFAVLLLDPFSVLVPGF